PRQDRTIYEEACKHVEAPAWRLRWWACKLADALITVIVQPCRWRPSKQGHPSRCCPLRRHENQLRRHGHAGPYLLQAVYDYLVVRRQSFIDDAQSVVQRSGPD